MKKSGLFLLGLTLSGCYAGVASPVPGFLYADVKSGKIGTSEVADLKKGVATCESILGLIAVGDCSVEAAKKNGGIAKVQYADSAVKNILGVYATYTTVVHGE
jgi:hypothetical protein